MKRYYHIDALRAFAILAVIAIHVLSDNLTSSLTLFLWNYLHIIIVAFVFCSGYVMYAVYAPRLINWSAISQWYKKRLIRLLLPLYWYLLAHATLLFLFPKFFSGLGFQLTPLFLFQSITLVGGINLNWLPLLFLQLAILFPLLVLAYKKVKNLFWAYVIFAFATTIGFTIWQFPYSHYRAVMWIPWSLFLVLPWYFYEREKEKSTTSMYLFLAVLGAAIFAGLFFIWSHIGRSLTLIDNKYPPNFFYISYEMFGSFLILAIANSFLFQNKVVAQFFQFISRVSYSLFFIHYIVFDFILTTNRLMGWHLSVWSQLLFVFVVSFVIAWGISSIQSLAKFSYKHIIFSLLLHHGQ